MSTQAPRGLPLAGGLLAVLALSAGLFGAARADDHDPVAVEPDAAYGENVQVATFALG